MDTLKQYQRSQPEEPTSTSINDPKMTLYALMCRVGHTDLLLRRNSRPRVPFEAQHVKLIDDVKCNDFPDLRFVTRHGCEPWEELAVKLTLKWPNLFYSTSAFAPKYYPKSIIDYANTRGAEKVLYAGYFPMGIHIDTIFEQLPNVPFRDHVWSQFLRENAMRVLVEGVIKISCSSYASTSASNQVAQQQCRSSTARH